MLIEHQALGAQILRLEDFFYLSPIQLTNNHPRRGGVPILFPQFADRGHLKKHGFVRNLNWQLITDAQSLESHQLTYRLQIQEKDIPEWPYCANLELSLNATVNDVEISLMICNNGPNPFSWTGGLHPYFFLSNLLDTSIKGLQNQRVSNRFDQDQQIHSAELLTLSNKPLESLFHTSTPLQIISPKQHFDLKSEGFTEWMIWNPAEQGADDFIDIPLADWKNFLCVEHVIVSKPLQLLPQASFTGKLTITNFLNSANLQP